MFDFEISWTSQIFFNHIAKMHFVLHQQLKDESWLAAFEVWLNSRPKKTTEQLDRHPPMCTGETFRVFARNIIREHPVAGQAILDAPKSGTGRNRNPYIQKLKAKLFDDLKWRSGHVNGAAAYCYGEGLPGKMGGLDSKWLAW